MRVIILLSALFFLQIACICAQHQDTLFVVINVENDVINNSQKDKKIVSGDTLWLNDSIFLSLNAKISFKEPGTNRVYNSDKQGIKKIADIVKENNQNEANMAAQIVASATTQVRNSLSPDFIYKKEGSLEKGLLYVVNSSTAFREVETRLDPDEAIVEFSEIPMNSDSVLYAARIYLNDLQTQLWILLCDQVELLDAMKAETGNPDGRLAGSAGLLYRLIWKDIEKELSDVKTVYYILTGLLNRINFNTLATGNEATILSDKYTLHLITGLTDVDQHKKANKEILQ